MLRVFTLFVCLPAFATGFRAAPSAPLSTLSAIHSLTNAEAGNGLPVAFEATVTYYSKIDVDLFVQDGNGAIYVEAKPNSDLAPGDRVLVRGKTRASFRPDVVSDSVTVLRHGPPPVPVPATFSQLMRSERDCMRVTVRARVRSADRVRYGNVNGVYLQLLMDGGSIDASVIGADSNSLKDLLDAEVEITGVVSGKFDSKMQLIGILIEFTSLADIKVLKSAAIDPGSLPMTAKDAVLASYSVRDLSRRVRVRGSITYYDPGSAMVLQDGEKSLWISTQCTEPIRVGDVVDVTGFPGVNGGFLTLNYGEIAESHRGPPAQPKLVTARELASGGTAFDLVSVEGRVVMAIREAAQDEYVLVSGGSLFSVIYRHPDLPGSEPLTPMKQVPVGSMVRVTGISMLHYGSDPFSGPVAFDLLIRGFDDVAVVAQPSALNTRNLLFLVGLLLAAVAVAGARSWTLERKVRRQNAASADLERRRRRILEDINGARPLSDIIHEITELVSFKLDGAPCWCQVADAARLGRCPEDTRSLRIVSAEIPGRSGPPLGTLFAAFDAAVPSRSSEAEALSMGTGLATLAIESNRFYADLLHRSEYDLLTDAHNRFSLDKHLDAAIETASRQAGIFGLIYIDLDDFKQVNDLYGHRAGDLYLQEMAQRMTRQLRSGDMLARLGGDEFAALAPMVRSRADVEDVALRLERCFDEPFEVEGAMLRGSASVGIAVYPEDGATKDSLLSTADAAMYMAKNLRHQLTAFPSAPRLTPIKEE